eukprot:3003665-Alexandrium_andersonii.AAC.1
MSAGYSNGCRAFRSSKVRNRLRRSKLELCGPRNGLKLDSPSSRGVHSARFAQMPTKQAGGRRERRRQFS